MPDLGLSHQAERNPAAVVRRLGLRLGWRAYERLPPGAERLFGLGRTYATCLLRPRIQLRRMRGTAGDGRPRTVMVAGAGSTIDYLLGRLFTSPPQVEACGSTSILALPDRLARQRSDDLILARVPRFLARRWSDERFLRLPEAVDAWLPLDRGDPLANANESVRRGVRKVRAAGMTWSLARDQADFEYFYDRLYLPFIHARFDQQAVVRQRSVLRRAFRQGGILWIERGEERVGGQLFAIDGRTLHVVAQAVDHIQELRRANLLYASTLCTMDYACSEGLTRLDLGGSLPSLRDGVLAHKKSWGAQLKERPTSHHDILVRWPSWNGRWIRFLADVPLVFRTASGLASITALPESGIGEPRSANRLWRQLAPAGLERLYVIAETWMPPDPAGAAAVASPARVWLARPGTPEVVLRSAQPCPL